MFQNPITFHKGHRKNRINYFIVTDPDGSEGQIAGSCPRRSESLPLNTTSRSLVLQNHFSTNPNVTGACIDNSASLITIMGTCQRAAGGRWPNYIAVDFYQVSTISHARYKKNHFWR